MAKGEKPIGIVWNMNNKRLDAKEEERYLLHFHLIIEICKLIYLLNFTIIPK